MGTLNGFRIAARGAARSFVITGGLREGYEADGKLHTLAEVVTAHHAWQGERKLVLGLVVSPADPSYGWPDGDDIRSATEPGFMLSGGINVQYDAKLSDDEARDRLLDLATFIAGRLGQTRVYVRFLGEDFILQAEYKQTPRE